MLSLSARSAFVFTFFALTALPGLQMITKFAPPMTVDENRALASMPSANTPINEIPKVADKWFSDHFGLRSILIRLKAQIDLSVFKMSDRVLVGYDGQLFYRSTVNDEVPAMQRLLEKLEQPSIDGIRDVTEALTSSGIHVAMIINLMSDRFYPDLLPGSAKKRPSNSRIDEFITKLQSIPELLFIDSTALLKEITSTRRVFHKTDFHWNDPAAFIVGKALVDAMSSHDWRPSPWHHPLEIEARPISGGIAMFMPVFAPPVEEALFVKQTWEWPHDFTQSATQGIFEYVTTSKADGLLPPVVLVGDSFSDGMIRCGLAAMFEETHRIRWKPGLKVSEIVEALPPDTKWVVIQFIEVSQAAISAFADKEDIRRAIQIISKR